MPPRRKKRNAAQPDLFEVKTETAPCVEEARHELGLPPAVSPPGSTRVPKDRPAAPPPPGTWCPDCYLIPPPFASALAARRVRCGPCREVRRTRRFARRRASLVAAMRADVAILYQIIGRGG